MQFAHGAAAAATNLQRLVPYAPTPVGTMKANLEKSVKSLEGAISKLETAVRRQMEIQAGENDLGLEVQTLSADRARLADKLDQASAKIEDLQAVNRNVSDRLVSAMETVSAVLQAELEEA